MRTIYTFTIAVLTGYSIYWVTTHPEQRSKFLETFYTSTFHLVEAKYSPQQIIESHYKMLIQDKRYTIVDYSIKFAPYILIEAKYTGEEGLTVESMILWDLVDGEMVINTSTWEKTHGFADCIRANLDRDGFKLINFLTQQKESVTKSLLQKIGMGRDTLHKSINNCKNKNLIIEQNDVYRLHLANPNFGVYPKTEMNEYLITKSIKYNERIKGKFNKAQIKKIAEFTFDQDFYIRNIIDVYLPIYCISLETPEGTSTTSYWNGITGKQIYFMSIVS